MTALLTFGLIIGIGLFIEIRKSLKEHNKLWASFEEKRRNDETR